MQLTNAINGKQHIDEKEAGDYRKCSLGKWYYDEGSKTLRGETAFQELGKWHADLHKTASQILRLVATGKKDEARAKLSEVEEYTKHVIVLLDDLKELSQVGA